MEWLVWIVVGMVAVLARVWFERTVANRGSDLGRYERERRLEERRQAERDAGDDPRLWSRARLLHELRADTPPWWIKHILRHVDEPPSLAPRADEPVTAPPGRMRPPPFVDPADVDRLHELVGAPVRSFSGSHPFRPVHLLEALAVEAPEGADLVGIAAELTERVDAGRCPRCGRHLPEMPEFPAGSRITACRCIPICGPCGVHEAFAGYPGGTPSSKAGIPRWGAWGWHAEPPSPADVDADVQAIDASGEEGFLDLRSGVVVTARGVFVGRVTPREHPGGWADPDSLVE